MAKYFKVPFGRDGDRTTIPEPVQPGGEMSYTEGWGIDYQLDPDTDPDALNIPRNETNELIFQTQDAIRVLQEFGFPEFITTSDNGGTPFPYAVNATVRFTGGWGGAGALNYYSLEDANTTTPADATKWGLVTYGSQFVTGDSLFWFFNTIRTGGWVWLNGTTIGNASSGATQRANADTLGLYTLLWTDYSNSVLPIQTSAGAASTRGASAAADFAANKRMPLPNAMNAAVVGRDGIGGATPTNRITFAESGINGDTLGSSGGAQSVALTSNQNGAHSHSGSTDSPGTHSHNIITRGSNTGGAVTNSFNIAPTAEVVNTNSPVASLVNVNGSFIQDGGSHSHTIATSSSGLGSTHQNTQPTLIGGGWIIKL